MLFLFGSLTFGFFGFLLGSTTGNDAFAVLCGVAGLLTPLIIRVNDMYNEMMIFKDNHQKSLEEMDDLEKHLQDYKGE